MIKGYALTESEYTQIVKLLNYTQKQLNDEAIKAADDEIVQSKIDSAKSCLKTVQTILNH